MNNDDKKGVDQNDGVVVGDAVGVGFGNGGGTGGGGVMLVEGGFSQCSPQLLLLVKVKYIV